MKVSPIQVKESGEFRAVVHAGHTYDKSGVEIHGRVIAESAWSHNLITAVGFGAQLAAPVPIAIVVGSGNTPPTLADTVLETYKGRRSAQTRVSRTVNLVPDSEGYCTITTVYRATFNPGSLGTGPVNISEAGTAMNTNPNATTSLYSRGLLVDDFGVPTTVSLNATTEYLDVYWRHVRYIPREILATATLTILGTPVVHDLKICPNRLDPAAEASDLYWQNNAGSADALPGFSPAVVLGYEGAYGPYVYDGAIGTPSANPSGNKLNYKTSSWTVAPYVAGSLQRNLSLNIIPTEANLVAGIKTLTLGLGFQGWQIEFNPVIMKNATPNRVLKLDFTISLANK